MFSSQFENIRNVKILRADMRHYYIKLSRVWKAVTALSEHFICGAYFITICIFLFML